MPPAICLEDRRWGLEPQQHQTYCHSMVVLVFYCGLFCSVWSCCSKEGKWNNEGGGSSPNSSGKPKIISRRLALWCSWVFQLFQWSQHISEVLKEWINQATIELLEWASQSPDLKKQVCARNLTNEVELQGFCQEEWIKIQPEDNQKKLVDGYQQHLTGWNRDI